MRFLTTLNGLALAVGAGLVVLYAFFVVMGAFSPAELIGVTALVVTIAALFVIHSLRVRRGLAEHEGVSEETVHQLQHLRERRGF